MSYTLQSTINGKYITNLFSDSHDKTFEATDIYEALSWKELRHCRNNKENRVCPIHNCTIVEVPNKLV